MTGGNNWTRKDERSEDGTANGKANAQTGEMSGIRTNGAVRRSVSENSDGNAEQRLSVSVSSDEVTGSAVRRAAVPPHRGLLRTAKSRGTNLGFFGGNNWTRKEHKVRRNSGKPSSDLRAEFTQDGGARQL